ncbi:MAG: TolC family protein [Saprospiraceae bacterium]|nr:TolC family protein [Saprospiraceae bacterium]
MRYLTLFLFFLASSLQAQERNLDFYINVALQNTPAFRDLRNQAELNRQDSMLVRAALRPQVSAGTAANLAPNFRGFGYDPALSNGGFLNALVSVNQPIFVPKQNLTAQFKALDVQNQSLQNKARLTEQDIRRSIGVQYITTYGTLQQLDFNRETLELLRREDAVYKRLTEQNIYRQTDYLTFLTSLRQQETTVRQLEIQYQNEFATLNYLSGLTDTTTERLPNPDLRFSVLPPVGNTIFYRQFTIDSLQIRANDQLIDIAYRPTVNLYSDAGFNSSFASQGWKNIGFSIGIGATVLLYDGQQRRLRHEKTALLENTRQGYRDFFLRQYEQEIAQAQQQLSALDQLDASVQAQLQIAHTLIEANGRLLRTGDARVVDYLVAISSQLNAQNQLALNHINRLQILNQLQFRNAPE